MLPIDMVGHDSEVFVYFHLWWRKAYVKNCGNCETYTNGYWGKFL